MRKFLTEKWDEGKETLLEGLSQTKTGWMSQVFENTRKQILAETVDAGTQSAGAIANFQKVVMPLIRRQMVGAIAPNLVGVQAMTGPVGLVYSMRYIFADAVDGNGDASNDIAAGDEAFANNSKMKRFYSTASVGTAGYPPALTSTASVGTAATTANYEGFGGRSMTLETVKQTVTAGERKLQARFTNESVQDLQAAQGLDLGTQLIGALGNQLSAELDNEILTDVLALAGSTATYDFAAPNGMTPHFIGDRYAELGVLINKLSQEIGAKTRIAPANWLVGSHLIVSLLQSATKSVFAPAVQGSFASPVGNRLVGKLNGQLDVYSYNWGLNDAWGMYAGSAANTAVGATGEDVLIGLKQSDGEIGAGYFYLPWIPVTSSGIVTDARTFSHAVSLSTRYGKAMFTNSATSLGNSADYYARILVKNVSFA